MDLIYKTSGVLLVEKKDKEIPEKWPVGITKKKSM
jgi:hypothetical protein